MKRILIFTLTGLLLSFSGKAQLKSRMLEFQKYPCVTLTQLNKNLYGLYKKKNIPPEAEELLKNLSEVNILNLDLTQCDTATEKNVYNRFRPFLDSGSGNYQLVKSSVKAHTEQRVYVRNQNDKISDLVVLNHLPSRLDIIELRGDIQAENISLLSKALNINGLTSLSALNPENESYQIYMQDFDANMSDVAQRLQEMNENIKKNFQNSFWEKEEFPSFFHLDNMQSFFDSLGMNPDMIHQFEKDFRNFSNNLQIQANSVEITEENGKTKIKINTKNSDMVYIVDGIEFDGEEVSMPAKIKSTRIVKDPGNPGKSYLIIMSQNPLGRFISFKNNVLKFNYDNQDYRFDLKKSKEPLIWMNGQLTDQFNLKPNAEIRQIRPVSEAEKKTGAFKSAEIIINIPTENESPNPFF